MASKIVLIRELVEASQELAKRNNDFFAVLPLLEKIKGLTNQIGEAYIEEIEAQIKEQDAEA